MRARSGTTLVEMLVYSATLSIFMTGVLSAFVLGRRHFFVASAQSNAISSTHVATNILDVYTATGKLSSLRVQSSPPACVFLSAKAPTVVFQTDASGKLYWQAWVCFYLDASTHRLMLSQQALSSPTTTAPTSAPSFTTMLSLPSRTVADNVQSISFTTGPPPSYQLVTQAMPSVSNGQPTGLAVGAIMTMRN